MSKFDTELEAYRPTFTEYKGRVFGWTLESPEAWLESESADPQDPNFWQRQAHWHHSHPGEEVEDCRTFEVKLIDLWRDEMSEQMPHHSFVIEVGHQGHATWYELLPGAPTEDGDWVGQEFRREDLNDEEFRAAAPYGFEAIQHARVAKFARHNSAACPLCKIEAGFSDPIIDAYHRGIQWKTCHNCGGMILHATRVIRYVVLATP